MTMDPIEKRDQPVLFYSVHLFSNKCLVGFHSSELHLRSRQSGNFTVLPEALMFTSFGEIRRSHLAQQWSTQV